MKGDLGISAEFATFHERTCSKVGCNIFLRRQLVGKVKKEFLLRNVQIFHPLTIPLCVSLCMRFSRLGIFLLLIGFANMPR